MITILKGEVTELRGIYSTKRAAEFIAQQLKTKENLQINPKITPTEAGVFPRDNKVEEYLIERDSRKTVMAKRKKVVKYLPKRG
jgi:hypothetical protein